ncbi:MAG TPA: carboxypeptidase-like regulatory domain-containing protein [Pyrinomonadaceae bacterium]
MKIKPLALLFFVLLLCAGFTQAQTESERWLMIEVTDAAGQPLKDACVTVVPKEGVILFDKADKRGHTKFKKLAAGNYRVVVKVEGYEAQKREVTVSTKSETITFALEPRAN